MMEDSDAAVVDLIRGGDVHAFRILVERHSHAAFRLAFRMTGNEQDAEDVVQEAFLRGFRRLGNFEKRSSFGTWLHRIIVSCSLDLLRRRTRQPSVQSATQNEDILALPSMTLAPDAEAAEADFHEQIRAALDQLTPQERIAFVLRHFECKSIEEVGSSLNLRTSAAKHSIFRAVKKIRAALEPILNETSHIL